MPNAQNLVCRGTGLTLAAAERQVCYDLVRDLLFVQAEICKLQGVDGSILDLRLAAEWLPDFLLLEGPNPLSICQA